MQIMATDPTGTQVIWAGVIAAILSTISAIVVAIVNNRRERGVAAESAMESTLRERIVLRDEQIADRDHTIAELEHQVEKLEEELQLYKDGRVQ